MLFLPDVAEGKLQGEDAGKEILGWAIDTAQWICFLHGDTSFVNL